MAKITIYVRDELKAEMDGFEALEPNWSAVAQEAFRLECQRLASRQRSSGKMDAVIERLRASKQKVANEDGVAGHKAGRDWAMYHAEADQLERVAEWEVPPLAEVPLVGYLSTTIDPDMDMRDAEEFWDDRAGHCRPSDEFVIGFAEGATEVWNEVADEL